MNSAGKGVLGGLSKLKHIEIIAVLIGAGLLLAFVIMPYMDTGGVEDTPAFADYDAEPSAMEGRLGAVLCRIEGAGAVEVFVTWEPDETAVRGVIVVAEGADDLGVQMALRRAVRAALDIDAGRVDVFAMTHEEEFYDD